MIADRRLRVFISHCSPTDEDRAWLEALVRGLGDGDDAVHVLCDAEQIAPGTRWRAGITQMLEECQAAIVLVTPAALKSAWVLNEASVVRHRHSVKGSRFRLLPLVRAGVDRSALHRFPLWGPIGIDEIQFLHEDDPAAAAAAIKLALRPAALALAASPLDVLVEDIHRRIKDCHELRVREAIARLDEPAAVADEQPHRALARAVASAMLRRHPPTLGAVAQALSCLERSVAVEGVIDAVGYLWVELEAAAGLLRASWRNDDCRDVVLACQRPLDTLRDYVDRAHAPWREPKLLLLNDVTGGAQVADIVAQLHHELRAWSTTLARTSDAELEAWLARVDQRIYVGLSLPPPDVVETLQRAYPRLTFAFHVPRERHEGHVELDGVEWLEPPLDPTLESEVAWDRMDAVALLAA